MDFKKLFELLRKESGLVLRLQGHHKMRKPIKFRYKILVKCFRI